MRQVLLAAALAAMAGPAVADPEAVQGVIGAQLDAFRTGDVAEAFTHASPGIAAMFRDPSRFGRMVREGYPMVARPGAVEFGRSESIGGDWGQEVLIEDADGALHRLLYRMVETPDGWKIGGVQLLEGAEVGV